MSSTGVLQDQQSAGRMPRVYCSVRCSTWRLKLPFVEQADFNGLQYRKLDQASVAQNREERQEAEVTQPELRSHYIAIHWQAVAAALRSEMRTLVKASG